ncbi:manganese catalase family protein [Halomonas sp. MCCC 1A17488]|uniref:manganese catalase family protein n=1 Tax=unclassified Halomonas TaxID=2609666 RepID=UPI0018D1FDD9|nr:MULTISPECIES: manganese catalase family protein [unclassified Halomonas]MCE8018182.1 manganese catalase family protein [Halomonas sp. MCCC 1A17488]MCG3241515.1 manganese catalase family protein [Halomonas sp. MCCC 1A17488]QPP48530.1 manganese catalase family protein [Halomonas sp. SS10-MC5]
MFHHAKELQFNARVSGPDPRFASLLLEQFGGMNGELKAAMQYFTQAFAARQPYPKVYDMLMDIATEEFSHLEIVGATIQMLMNGVNGELKDISEQSEIMQMITGKAGKENIIHEAMVNPMFLAVSGGGPTVTNSQGVPWSGYYVDANGDLTVDLRSDIAAETRAKITYEYLMQFTDDPEVKETLKFLMTREVAHHQMFEAALSTLQPNFPPGVTQGDPRYSNLYFNMSKGQEARGPWNEGKSPMLGETWQYIDDPQSHVETSDGLRDQSPVGSSMSPEEADKKSKEVSELRSREIKGSVPKGSNQWSRYDE